MTRLCFIDIETTGLDPDRHHIFEVAVIAVDGDDVREHEWFIDVDLSTADANALRLNHYYARRAAQQEPWGRWLAAEAIAPVVAESVLIGANPSFDDRFLTAFLRAHGQAPAWHYRSFDIETAAAAKAGIEPPWRSSTEMCERAVGVPAPTPEDRHTAMGDVRWAKAVYDAVYRRAKPTRAKPRVGARADAAPAPATTTDRDIHPLVNAPHKAFLEGLAELEDPAVLAWILDDARHSPRRAEAIAARMREVAGAPDADADVDEDGPTDDDGRPEGMPGPDEQLPCEECGQLTEAPARSGMPSMAQLSWTRYRKVLCATHLNEMRVSS